MSNEELVARIQNGEPGVMVQLWEQVELLAKWKAVRIINALNLRGSSCGVEFEDLVQCGYPALVSAVASYSPDKGSFSSWFLLYLKTEFSEATGYRTKSERCEPLNNALSLDKPMGEDADGEVLGDLLPDLRATATMESVEEREYREQLRDALEKVLNELPDGYGDVLRLRYYKGFTLDDTGKTLGISAEQARLREGKGLRKLRAPKVVATLRPFYDFNCYCGTGLSAFRSSGLSVQERYLAMQDRRGGRP